MRAPRAAGRLAALVVAFGPLVGAAAEADVPPAPARVEVYLVGRAARPALARQIRDRLEPLGRVRVRRVRRLPAQAERGWAITLHGREARIHDLRRDRVVRRVPLRRGLNAAGRATITQALRTVVEASRNA
ncbi:MAG TPA: hypothetical protein RMH85_01415 [Polyangiaceae bacterium LLY-WYZ-15_(1-7)]|nr:hypothetical protein [Polyangiaceae bacterium LLY-WYZ-15_(1-7)]HJL07121.1 hypothetical protein [Polyangiaceae bacterium LLY-WYZ-15_(1-7)]